MSKNCIKAQFTFLKKTAVGRPRKGFIEMTAVGTDRSWDSVTLCCSYKNDKRGIWIEMPYADFKRFFREISDINYLLASDDKIRADKSKTVRKGKAK